MNRILWNGFKWFLRTGNRRSYVVIRSGVVMPLQQRSCIWWHLYTFKPHRAKPKVKHVSSSITKLFKGESETVADRKSTDTRWSKQKRPKTSLLEASRVSWMSKRAHPGRDCGQIYPWQQGFKHLFTLSTIFLDWIESVLPRQIALLSESSPHHRIYHMAYTTTSDIRKVSG